MGLFDFNSKDKNLGKKGRDVITQFEGIITAKITYLTGCDQYGLTPDYVKDGKTIDPHYFDVNRIEIIGDGIQEKKVKVVKKNAKGGPPFKPKSTDGRH